MKRLLGAGIAAVLFCGSQAFAADIPARAPAYKAPAVAPVFNWTGFYVGVAGGFARASTHWESVPPGDDFSGDGGIFGGTAGLNWQAGSLVLGVEGDFSWTNLAPSTTAGGCGVPCTSKLNWLATVRGRVGFTATPTMLIYATGGVAFGEINNTLTPSNLTSTPTGWTAGGGVEFMLSRNWTVKGEYLHVDFGSTLACTFAVCGGPPLNATYFRIDIVRVGINYKF